MISEKHKKRNIFPYIVYVTIAVAALAIIKYYTKPKPVDKEDNKNMTMFIEKAIFDTDQKLEHGYSNEDIATWISWQKSSAALYDDAKKNKDETIRNQSKVLRNHLTKVQSRDFPKLREAYVNSKKDLLSKEKIEILSTGSSKDALTFSGNFFEPENNKKEFLKGIEKIVKDLRFKKVVFKWSDKATDFTDYKIKSKSDSEI